MLGTNLKILAVVFGTVGFYTMIASSIPQVESEVPEELTFTADVTAEQLVVAGEQLYQGAGCEACHALATRAPSLLGDANGDGLIGARCATREPGKSCKDYLHEAMVEPNVFLVAGFQPIMPDISRTLSPAQIWSIIAYLESLGGEVTVTGADIGSAPAAPPAGGAPAAAPATMEPVALLRELQCIACHVLNGEGGPIGPPLDGMGGRISTDLIRRGIIDPDAEAAAGYEAVTGIMPKTFGQQLTASQLEVLVSYLASLR